MKDSPIRRRIEFEGETWHALDRLAKGRMQTLQELADEAFLADDAQRDAARERAIASGE